MQHLRGNDEGVTFSINGNVYHAGSDVEVDTSLNTYIREHANLKGTKYMCKEGGCGACIVTLTYTHPYTHQDVTLGVNSCLVPVLSCHGQAITTIEGIGNKTTGYHKVQKALASYNGTQCGYCSPGMVMNMFSLLKQNPGISMEEVENSFGGSICRCTGYRPILDAFKSLTINASPQLKKQIIDIEDISVMCTLRDSNCKKDCTKCPKHKRTRTDSDEDYSNMFIETSMAPKILNLKFRGQSSWYRVSTVQHIFELFDFIGDVSYMLVAGNTAKGVYKEAQPLVYIDITEVAELRGYQIYSNRIELGANITLAEMILLFEKVSHENYLMFGYTKKLAEHIDLVANVPVRNKATLAGNLMIKWKHREFPSDLFLLLATSGASITIRGSSGIQNTVPIVHLLEYNMYKQVILSVTIPALSSNHYIFRSFKIMPRRQNVHALVNAGFLFRFQWNQCIVEEEPTIVFGHITPDFVYAYHTQDYLTGQSLLNPNVLRNAILSLTRELQPNYDPPEASPAYRKHLAIGLFYKFILGVNGPKARTVYQSGGEDLIRSLSSGMQTFPTSTKEPPVHQPVRKIEGQIQCSGEAEYIDDMPKITGELHGALVIAKIARSKIVTIDASQALNDPGVIAFYSAKDIPGINSFVMVDGVLSIEEEELFSSGEILYAGQPIGMIVAVTNDLALKAAKEVDIKYSDIRKPLMTIKEVLASRDTSRIQPAGSIEPIDTQGNIAHKITGEFELETQYHYTMELQTCLSVPIEDGLDVYSATQWMHNTQAVIARVLSLPLNSINVHVRRLGGAYGAKVTRSAMVSAACSLAAYKLQKPVRMVLDLQTNMQVVGKRCPAYSKYEVDVDEHGKIQKLQIDLYENLGCHFNDNVVFLTRDGIKNCYDFSNWKVNFYNVKTDTASTTWVRAPGMTMQYLINCTEPTSYHRVLCESSTEGISTLEHIMEHIANVCKQDPLNVRMLNVNPSDKSTVQEIIQSVLTSSNYKTRMSRVKNFNRENRWRKKGISVMPMKFEIIFLPGFHSMVSIFYNDGSVAIQSGGIEMGQGINTKIAQVCAYALGIDMSLIKIKPAYSVVSPNDLMTAGSMASDTITYATLKACEILNRRLQPIKERLTNPTWIEVLTAANRAGVDLNASYMYNLSDPVPKKYSVYGATVLEVEVDIITGQYQICRADIEEDAGESLSPYIDIGQVEGAFTMGLGYFMSEQCVFDKKTGKLLTDRTWTYWPPGAKDIPIDFRITIKKNGTNPRGTLRSKATGEPPLCMSFAIVMALRHALLSARKDAGLTDDWIPFFPPCTFERTCLAAGTSLDQFKL